MGNDVFHYPRRLVDLRVPHLSGGSPTVYGAPYAAGTAQLDQADVAFVGVPWGSPVSPEYVYMSSGANFGSTVLSPGAFRMNSLRHGGYLPELDVDVFEHLSMVDRGDLPTSGPMEDVLATVDAGVGEIIEHNCIPITFGGNAGPSSYGVLASVCDRADGPVSVLNLDAHHDNIEGDWTADDPRDILWAYTWANQIFSLPGVEASKYRHFGLRGPLNDRDLFARWEARGVDRSQIYTYREIKAARREGYEAWCDRVAAELVADVAKVWIAIDVDVLNLGSSIEFGDEPLGPTADEVIELMYAVGRAAGREKLGGISFMAVPHGAQSLHYLCSYMILYALAGVIAAEQDSR
jgi:agmatinase